MGLTVSGIALLLLVLMWIFHVTGRLALVVAFILGAVSPLAAQAAAGVTALGSAIAPLFNGLGGGLG